MPIAIAICWSSAMARSASPVRLRRKNQLTTATQTVAIAAVRSFSGESGRPPAMSGSDGKGSGIALGIPPSTRGVAPRMSMPRPRVTMITEIIGRPTSRRRTSRLKTRAPATVAAHARPMAPASPRPIAWRPVATSREPSIAHSPSAKLTMREVL